MKAFIEIETAIGIVFVNFNNVDCVTKNRENGTAIISFTTGSDDYMNTLEPYEEVRQKIADIYRVWVINQPKYIHTEEVSE